VFGVTGYDILNHDQTLPPWLWLPAIVFAITTISEPLLSAYETTWLVSEGGPYELLQFLIVSLALCFGLYTIVTMPTGQPWLRAWIGIACLGCFYVAGEEVSWGQHFLQWATPEFWSGVNDQNETNFHNTSSWLDQKPRILLIIGVYIGGLIIPALQARKPDLLPARFSIIYPTKQFVVTALICLFIKLSDKVGEATDIFIYWRGAETEELFIYYFVLLYLILMRARLAPGDQDRPAIR